MRNKFAGTCKDCGTDVPPEAGYIERQRWGGWRTRCVLCVALGRAEKGHPLSIPQKEALAQHQSRFRD